MITPVKYSKLLPYQKKTLRESYVKDQKGLCYWCKSELVFSPPPGILNKPIHMNLFPPGFLNPPIHLQHDHDTDLTEGAVHAYCNAVMWQYYGR